MRSFTPESARRSRVAISHSPQRAQNRAPGG
jgi:hypothetical protein